MIGLIRDNNFYIRIPKNGITTFYGFLTSHGYREINLFDEAIDPSTLNMWGHLTDPLVRHTKGVAEFLNVNPDVDYRDPVIGRMLISGMFDSHTYTVHMMLGHLVKYPITWIPLDAKIQKFNDYPVEPEILDGDRLTNIYFKEQNLNFEIDKTYRKNVATEKGLALRKIVEDLKKQYDAAYQQLVKNVLEADLLLYHRTLLSYHARFGQ